MRAISRALSRGLTVEHFHSVKEQSGVYAQFETMELSLHDVLNELKGIYEGQCALFRHVRDKITDWIEATFAHYP
jgi:hypothetical protein